MSALDERLGRRRVNTRYGHRKGGRQNKGASIIPTEADLRDHLDIVVCEAVARLSADTQEGVLEARGIAACKELLWVGRAAGPAEGLRERQFELEQAVIAPNRSMAASARCHLR